MIAFRIGDPPAYKELSSGAPAQSAAPLCEGFIASRLRRISICDAAASSPWTVDPPIGEPRFSWRRGVPPPKLYRSLGLTFRRGSSFIRVRLPLPFAIATGNFAVRSIPSLLSPNKPLSVKCSFITLITNKELGLILCSLLQVNKPP